MRRLLEQVGTVKAERESIERTLRDNMADISEGARGQILVGDRDDNIS